MRAPLPVADSCLSARLSARVSFGRPMPRSVLLPLLLAFLACFVAPLLTGCGGDDDDASLPGDDDGSGDDDTNPGDDDTNPGDDDTSSTSDLDQDGYPAPADCNDQDSTVHPGAPEACDGKDNDCDSQIDDGAISTFYRDADGDGYGVSSQSVNACPAPAGYAAQAGDCDDGSADVHPNGLELCDSKDNDCNGQVDDGAASTWYRDSDSDGFGDPAHSVSACPGPDGYVLQGGDCNDASSLIHPGAAETCNADGSAPADEDCDGQIDEGLPATLYYPDADNDGFGTEAGATSSCVFLPGYTVYPGDCDDTDFSINPGSSERCDGRDDDCDGQIDDRLAYDILFADADGDGYGDPDRPILACGQLAGLAWDNSDCDDQEASIHPFSAELCDADGSGDGVDSNCNGAYDEGRDAIWYRDLDGDGFGDTATTTTGCSPGTGWVAARGDCDDSTAAIHPGAADATGDGMDQDCGGSSGPEPHVGLGGLSLASIQAALDAASSGATVWVGPGTYLEHDLSFKGKAIKLRATGSAAMGNVAAMGSAAMGNVAAMENVAATGSVAASVIDAQQLGRGFLFNKGEGAGSVLDGFVITHGKASTGAGIFIDGSSPSISGCLITGNLASSGGGGVYVSGSGSPSISGCTVSGNSAGAGGGLMASGGSPTISSCIIRDNVAKTGGGLQLFAVSATISGCSIVHNQASDRGAGVFADSPVSIQGSDVNGNVAGGSGGGLYLKGASSLLNVSVIGNRAGGVGASSDGSSGSGSIVTGNGGGIDVAGAVVTLTNLTVASNRAALGGGVYGEGAGASITIDSSILVFNQGYGLYVAAPTTAKVSFSDLYNVVGAAHNLAGLENGNLQIDPKFQLFFHGRNSLNDEYHLSFNSPVANLGDPSVQNPDGSRADMGVYGGPGADRGYYQDLDKDGMYDGWERRFGLDTARNDASVDLDKDGSSNVREFASRSNPRAPDTDDDGSGDGDEYLGNSDATDFYSRPGMKFPVTVQVPGDFDTVQAAIEAIKWSGVIAVAAGSWEGGLQIDARAVTIQTAAGGATVLEGVAGSVIAARWATLDLQGATVQGGLADRGGGILLDGTAATLNGVSIEGCDAGLGAGMHVTASSGAVTGLTVEGGCGASLVDLEGSSLSLSAAFIGDGLCEDGMPVAGLRVGGGSTSAVDGAELRGNSGRGVEIDASSPGLESCWIVDNSGGGVWMGNGGGPVLGNCRVEDNGVEDISLAGRSDAGRGAGVSGRVAAGLQGGGVYVSATSAQLSHCLIRGNHAGEGGGLYLSGTSSSLSRCVVDGNDAGAGGGLFLTGSSPGLSGCVITGNGGDMGGGVYLYAGSKPSIRDSILAYNAVYNVFADNGAGQSSASILWSDLYSPTGQNHNLDSLDPSNRTLEPRFQAYASGLPTNWHLASGSPLIDGGEPTEYDLDGTKLDPGVYGGLAGGKWDLDGDGAYDYFWPGEIGDAPGGFDPGQWDCDDMDGSVWKCAL